ncbi:hypothetical protein [Vampirovibrio chlorellavorus]|uniref:hypothetical protein n=1 Tax=Vampirovibrio chlorellavorus TaxID=758823 RepID=UPI0026EABF71|nr:hypothetical protein [Vampirovibrio chlorellavorus]
MRPYQTSRANQHPSQPKAIAISVSPANPVKNLAIQVALAGLAYALTVWLLP